MALIKWWSPKTDADPNANQEVRVINAPSTSPPFPDFDQAVADAMLLLMYAAENGKNVDDSIRVSILRARTVTGAGADETVIANLLSALTKLAADLSPITAASLRASSGKQAKPTITNLRTWAWLLVVPIILFSVLAFVSSSISSALRADITTANDLVVKLRAELGSPEAPTAGTPEKPELPKGLNEADVITQLQQYASTIRAIDARALQLNYFVFKARWVPFSNERWTPTQTPTDRQKFTTRFQLPVGLPNMPAALNTLTGTYQEERSFAQDILDLVSVYYGAVTICLLPVLYALLGTCAYLLRSFEEQLRTLTFTPSARANGARFLIAGIGGAVVGLFGNLNITQGASISPLAVAFLVGYAVDVFFSFLEGLLQAFTKRKSGTNSQATGIQAS